MGWDAFWLPAENYAMKKKLHPKIVVSQNIQKFKEQIESLGISYDWNREINTTDPQYYKWTQWIFLKMFEHGLAYEQDLPIHYCPQCKTGLAHEEVLSNGRCERCFTLVEKRKIRQWVLAITKYAERLLEDLKDLEWPESIKTMQREWIGKSEGVEFSMPIQNTSYTIHVFTTRIDTVFAVTYVAIAPEIAQKLLEHIPQEYQQKCKEYIETSIHKLDEVRIIGKEKTGVFTGLYARNPFTSDIVPIFVADYVLGDYGTWAVMWVPGHDERDYAFAKAMDIPIKTIIHKNPIHENEEYFFEKTGYVFLEEIQTYNEEIASTLQKNEKTSIISNDTFKQYIITYAQKHGFWKLTVQYKMRDWLFSRQRYWGEPIPLIHIKKEDIEKLPHIASIKEADTTNFAYVLERIPTNEEYVPPHMLHNGKIKELVINHRIISKIYKWLYDYLICDYNLPVMLPDWDYDSLMQDDGYCPLEKIDAFVHVSLASNLQGKRETNTMPQWAGSCWYYLRYMDPHNTESLVSKEAQAYWNQVDSYVWGVEHAVLHLLYARFWHKFLYDIGIVTYKEPFFRLRNQGLILAYAYQTETGKLIPLDMVEEKEWEYIHKETQEKLTCIVAKMSKSLKNVVNPNEVIAQYGADAFRLYEMYLSDFKDATPWNTKNILWVVRFLEKVWNLFHAGKTSKDDRYSMKLLHKTIQKVSQDIEEYKFNTAISALMILVNEGHPKDEALQREWKETLLILLHPFAPHIAEELWNTLWKQESIFFAPWPKVEQQYIEDTHFLLPVQINGKLRTTLTCERHMTQEAIIEYAKNDPTIQKWIWEKQIQKVVYVPYKILNFVVR